MMDVPMLRLRLTLKLSKRLPDTSKESAVFSRLFTFATKQGKIELFGNLQNFAHFFLGAAGQGLSETAFQSINQREKRL
jgi:hypothetical protein